MVLTGRRRLRPDELEGAVADYCARYGVARKDEGFPPFPTGKRETDQHREWLRLYKARERLRARAASADGVACPVCALVDGSHAGCRALLKLARHLGPEALERVRRHLWPRT